MKNKPADLQTLREWAQREQINQGFKIMEIANTLHIGHNSARRLVRKALEAGIMERVNCTTEGIDGRIYQVAGFRFIDGKRKNKKLRRSDN